MPGFRFNSPLQSGTDKTLDALIHAAYAPQLHTTDTLRLETSSLYKSASPELVSDSDVWGLVPFRAEVGISLGAGVLGVRGFDFWS